MYALVNEVIIGHQIMDFRRQAIIWRSAALVPIGSLGTRLN